MILGMLNQEATHAIFHSRNYINYKLFHVFVIRFGTLKNKRYSTSSALTQLFLYLLEFIFHLSAQSLQKTTKRPAIAIYCLAQ